MTNIDASTKCVRTVVLEFAPLDLANGFALGFKSPFAEPRIFSVTLILRHIEEAESLLRVIISALFWCHLTPFPQFDRRILEKPRNSVSKEWRTDKKYIPPRHFDSNTTNLRC